MRILHFSTNDSFGGAAKAGYALHTALRDSGHSSHMIVRYKNSDDEDVFQVSTRPFLSGYRRLRRRLPSPGFRPNRDGFNLDVEPEIQTAEFFKFPKGSVDVICLHWITNLLTTRKIRQLYDHYGCPIVWLMVDQEPVTGGCHYSLGCDGYKRQCGKCPQLKSRREHDRSRTVWNRKQRHLSGLPLVFIACTSWVKDRINESSLFRNHRVVSIPLAIDTNIFRPFDKRVARDLLHLPLDKKIVFFGATYLEEERKGMAYLVEALRELAGRIEKDDYHLSKDNIFLAVAGAHSKTLLKSLPFPGCAFGHVQDSVTLALAYQAADVFVCPSIEDAGPMMIAEAMLCGTPVVAFDTGGAPDLVETERNGYLARMRDSKDLSRGIYCVLTADNQRELSKEAHDTSIRFHSARAVAEQHLKLYESLTG